MNGPATNLWDTLGLRLRRSKGLNEGPIRQAIESIFGHAPYLKWYARQIGVAGLGVNDATYDFCERSALHDISPVRFFDPTWFRKRYRVVGVNAFVSYMRDANQQLAWPSPIFAPRWYCRRHALSYSSKHPLLHFLLGYDDRSPHPLLDVKYLRDQSLSWRSNVTAFEYLDDVEKYRLRPHPLFDGNWYLDNYQDVAARGLNPLEHYLQFGYAEERNPNRIFSVRWYRDVYQTKGNASRAEPLTSYVTEGFVRGHTPLPGLNALAKTSTKLTERGPKSYIDSIADDGNIFARVKPAPEMDAETFHRYTSGCIQDYNQSFPGNIVLLPKKRVALMYTPKCASARIVYWWLDQANLLDVALQFSFWPHSFENLYRASKEYLRAALLFDPDRYSTYKFVRNPLFRAVSSFAHFLSYPNSFRVAEGIRSISFMDFLDRLDSPGFKTDPHFMPQITSAERAGKILPRILKVEHGLAYHFRSLENVHGLHTATFEQNTAVKQVLRHHTKQNRSSVSVGPDIKIKFYSIPNYNSLLTHDSISKIFEFYRIDFETYQYKSRLTE